MHRRGQGGMTFLGCLDGRNSVVICHCGSPRPPKHIRNQSYQKTSSFVNSESRDESRFPMRARIFFNAQVDLIALFGSVWKSLLVVVGGSDMMNLHPSGLNKDERPDLFDIA